MITKTDAVAAIEAVNELAYTQYAINMLTKAIAAINALPDSPVTQEINALKDALAQAEGVIADLRAGIQA